MPQVLAAGDGQDEGHGDGMQSAGVIARGWAAWLLRIAAVGIRWHCGWCYSIGREAGHVGRFMAGVTGSCRGRFGVNCHRAVDHRDGGERCRSDPIEDQAKSKQQVADEARH